MTKDAIDALVEHARRMTDYIERVTAALHALRDTTAEELLELYLEGIALLPKKETK